MDRLFRSPASALLLAVVFVLGTLPARAGMSSIVISDLAQARLEVLSFFALGYLLLAWAVKGLWNTLRTTFRSLPALSYRASLALMLVSGLLMYVILTMISGARELMTPGAWQRQGVGYQLRDEPPDTPKGERFNALDTLKRQLWSHAERHDGVFPASLFDPAFPRDQWRHPSGDATYCYLPPGDLTGRKVLVYEPATAGARRYVLLSDGSIELWKESTLSKALRP